MWPFKKVVKDCGPVAGSLAAESRVAASKVFNAKVFELVTSYKAGINRCVEKGEFEYAETYRVGTTVSFVARAALAKIEALGYKVSLVERNGALATITW